MAQSPDKPFIKSFKIEGLFGKYNVDIPFDNNINIFVGENGLGKTTILNTLNYVLQGDARNLLRVDFNNISIKLGNGKILNIHKNELSEDYATDSIRAHAPFGPPSARKEIALEILKTGGGTSNVDDNKRNIIAKIENPVSPFAADRLFEMVSRDKKYLDSVRSSWEYTIYEYAHNRSDIVYLPTYRRIEEDFSYLDDDSDSVFRHRTRRSSFPYLKFGMNDVQKLIDNACFLLKNRTNEGFKEMTSNLLTNYIKISEGTHSAKALSESDISKLDIVFSRLTDKIKPAIKTKILEMLSGGDNGKPQQKEDRYRQFLVSIVHELTNIYENSKSIDDSIENFKDVCNSYLLNKEFIYDQIKIECSLIEKYNNSKIPLKCLSSGEKQIISLFSKLYLGTNNSYTLLFDEPELSLSISWQRKLLPDIIKSKKCGFLFAITHSPFIFDNELLNHTRDIDKFITKSK